MTFMNFLDLIFPKKCINCGRFGDFICPNCFSKISYNSYSFCAVCNKHSIDGTTHPGCLTSRSIDGVVSAVSYNKLVKKLIYKFKYEPNLRRLDAVIGEIFVDGLSQNEIFYKFIKRRPTVVAIPLSRGRFKKRGYNHAELLGSYVAQYFALNNNSQLLVRVKDTRPQFKLSREERLKNLKDAFAISKKYLDSNKNVHLPSSVVLVDDIATSFATFREAAKVLKRAGVRHVLGVAFAHEAPGG
ncbi:MAG TPA: ComF family protein [Patescibacteria group bacterium]|nr:ComF family protein [Patescibacteria group bacterium]